MTEVINPEAIATQTAYGVLRKFRRYVEFEDLQQMAYVWLYTHTERLEVHKAEENVSLGAWRLARDIRENLTRYARKERAAKVGYETEDEAYYTPGVIALVLPHVLAGDMQPPTLGDSDGRSNGDPAEGGNWATMYLDIQRAWVNCALSKAEWDVLSMILGEGLPHVAVAALMGTTPEASRQSYMRGLRKLSAWLGGPKPQGCPYDCECHEGRLRRRPVGHTS